MDFTHSELQTMLADSIGKFIDNEYDFDTRQTYAGSERGFSDDVWATFAELGWTALPFAEEDGGIGGDAVDLMVLMQNIARGLVVEPYLANVVLAGGVLGRAANEAQKAQWLYPLIAGDLQATLAFVEPQSRYDVTDIATTAARSGGDWILNGSKGLVPNGGTADLVVVPARTSGQPGDTAGITLFAVPGDTRGLQRTAYATFDGLRAAEIAFDGVRVPADHVLGEVDAGFAALDATIDDATLAVCAEAVGLMQALTNKTVEYAKQREQFGVPIGTFQALQHRMVDMLMSCEKAQSALIWAVLARAGSGDDVKRAISTIKYLVGSVGQKVGEEAVQIHGGMGVTWELDVAHQFKRLTAINRQFGNADWHLDRLAT
ncbi:MAG: pimeloyl-CoA dehydrogenase small subunit [Woeseiaceae bacterium]|nr:acyl-CoA dehydrogenase [Gammaproteobacteria bacterium]NNK25396.1 pimeloyl-CoA dehydrogenase small subunit [Woeseiaceae bacterium]